MRLTGSLRVAGSAGLGLALLLVTVGRLDRAWAASQEEATEQPTPGSTKRPQAASPDRIEGTVVTGSGSTFLATTPIVVANDSALGTVTLTWDTGLNAEGELYVSRSDEPEVLVARLPSGSIEVSWIDPDSTYEFRLYAGREHMLMLATLTVSRESVGLVSPEEWAELTLWRSATPAPSPDRALDEFGVPASLLCGLLAVAALYAHRRGQARSARRLLITLAIVSIGLSAGSPWAAEPKPFDQQPAPDARQYADSARNLAAGRGYITLRWTGSLSDRGSRLASRLH